MNELEERNLVWNLLELLIIKYDLKSSSEFLDPLDDNDIIFGNFVEGNQKNFRYIFKDLSKELKDKLPSNYNIVKNYIISNHIGIIGLQRNNL